MIVARIGRNGYLELLPETEEDVIVLNCWTECNKAALESGLGPKLIISYETKAERAMMKQKRKTAQCQEESEEMEATTAKENNNE